MRPIPCRQRAQLSRVRTAGCREVAWNPEDVHYLHFCGQCPRRLPLRAGGSGDPAEEAAALHQQHELADHPDRRPPRAAGDRTSPAKAEWRLETAAIRFPPFRARTCSSAETDGSTSPRDSSGGSDWARGVDDSEPQLVAARSPVREALYAFFTAADSKPILSISLK